MILDLLHQLLLKDDNKANWEDTKLASHKDFQNENKFIYQKLQFMMKIKI